MRGSPAVLIPGTLCDGRLFEPMAGLLGDEPIFAPPIAHATVSEAAEALLDAAPARFSAVGFSLGGFVVLELLRRAPDRLSGAVLVASNAHPLADGQAPARREEVEYARRAGMPSLIESLWPRYVASANRDRIELKTVVVEMAETVGVERFARQAELAIVRPDSRETVRASDVPLLVLCGAEDAMCPPDRCGASAAGPNARLVVLDGVGHFIPLEAPDAAAAAIAAWMQDAVACC